MAPRLGILALALALASGCNGGGGRGAAPAAPPFQGARVVTARTAAADLFDPSLDGSAAIGRVGDVLLANDRVRVLIQAPGRDEGPGPYGGTIIDAALQPEPGRPLNDEWGELTPMFSLGMSCRVTEVQVLRDGGAEEASVVLARGAADVLDLLDIPGLIDIELFALGELGAAIRDLLRNGLPPFFDPGATFFPSSDVQADCETRYELAPDSRAVLVTTRLTNRGTERLYTFGGDVLDPRGDQEWFFPGLDIPSLGFGEQDFTQLDWVGFKGRAASYGYFPPRDPETGAPDGIVIAAAGVGGAGLGSTRLEDVVAPQLGKGPHLKADPGESVEWTRRFIVGDGSISSISEVVYETLGVETGALSGSVVEAGTGAPLAGARVTALLNGDFSRPVTQFVTGADGRFSGRLPPGAYGLVAAAAQDAMTDTRPLLLTPVFAAVESEAKAEAPPLVIGRPALLRIEIRDAETGAVLPGKASFVGVDRTPASRVLFDTGDRTRRALAQVYFLTGADRTVEAEPGEYMITVSHGPEFDLVQRRMTLGEGDNGVLRAELTRVLDTAGWASADFHVHLLPSPDSAVTKFDRLRNFVADQVDIIVPTDHDVVTDLKAEILALGFAREIASIPGIEISPLTYGHFNMFPLTVDPESRSGGAITHTSLRDLPVPVTGGDPTLPTDADALTPAQIFEAMDALMPGTQVRQINHPRPASRGSYIGLFRFDFRAWQAPGMTGFDPTIVRLPEDAALYPPGMASAMELQNGGSLARASLVMNDWFALLHLGERVCATAVSDTHVHDTDVGGWGRTYVRTEPEEPAAINALSGADRAAFHERFAEAVGGLRATDAYGLFVTAELVDDDPAPGAEAAGLGETLTTGTPGAFDGTARLRVRVQAPPWAEYDRIDVFIGTPARANPEETFEPQTPGDLSPDLSLALDGPPGAGFSRVQKPVGGSFRWETELEIPVTTARDAWVVVDARGSPGLSRTLFPVIPSNDFAIGPETTLDDLLVAEAPGSPRAHGHTNPIFWDADGDGRFDPAGTEAILPPLPKTKAARTPPAALRLREARSLSREEIARAVLDLVK